MSDSKINVETIELGELTTIANLYNSILSDLYNNNSNDAKKKSWLAHEIVCTKFGGSKWEEEKKQQKK